MQLLKKMVKSAKMNKIFDLLSCSQGATASMKLFGHVTASTRPTCAWHTENTCLLRISYPFKTVHFCMKMLWAWRHENKHGYQDMYIGNSHVSIFQLALNLSFPKTISSMVSSRPRIMPNSSLQQYWKRGGGGEGLVEKACTCLNMIMFKIYIWRWILFHGTKQAKQVIAKRTGLNQLVTEFREA